MPFDAAKWQITLAAQDATAAAFNSLQQRMKQTEIVAAGVQTGMTNGFAALSRALAPLAAAYSAAAVAQKIWNAGMKAANLQEQADQIGLTTDLLQAYRLEAAQNGVSVEQLDTVMMKLTRSMGDANNGSKDAIDRFDKLGVKLLTAGGELRGVSDVLPELARGLLAVSSETERNALMMEIFGRSGTRMVTMLEGLAGGNARLTDAAKRQNAIITQETIKAWDTFADRLETAKIKSEALWARLAAPIILTSIDEATSAIDRLNSALDNNQIKRKSMVLTDLEELKKQKATQEDLLAKGKNNGKSWWAAFGLESVDPEVNLKKINAQIAELEKRAPQAKKELDDIVTAKINRTIGLPVEPTPPFLKQPKPEPPPGSGGSGDSWQKKLDALIVERKALEDALSKMELRGDETVAEMDKRLDREVALQKKMNSLTEGLPKDSAQAQQLRDQATAVAQLNQKLEDKKRILTEAEQTIAKYGDGTREAARATKELDEQLAQGAITPAQHAAALRDVTLALQEQQLAVRGRNEGFDAFTAGMEKMITQSSKLSRSFQYGEKFVQLFDDAIAQLVQNGEINFNRLLGSFITMIAQMEMKAAASSVWGLIGGGAGGGGGLLGGLINGIVNVAGGFSFDGMASGSTLAGLTAQANTNIALGKPGLAIGGPVSSGQPYLVGERGPELFIPHEPGRISPDTSLGGESVVISMNNNFGGGVTHAEMLRYGAMIEERARAGAMAGIEAKRKRGGSIKQVFRG